MEFSVSKFVNDSNEILVSWSEFYEVKPTSALEF